jgi:hypothetical protein
MPFIEESMPLNVKLMTLRFYAIFLEFTSRCGFLDGAEKSRKIKGFRHLVSNSRQIQNTSRYTTA